jgi:hypothetical protein
MIANLSVMHNKRDNVLVQLSKTTNVRLVLEIILLVYAGVITSFYYQLSLRDCMLSERSLLSGSSTNNDWVQKHIIGIDNFPSSSVEIQSLFSSGFNQKNLCRGADKSLCDSDLFHHSKQSDTLHGNQLIYLPFELGESPISVDQVCHVSE